MKIIDRLAFLQADIVTYRAAITVKKEIPQEILTNIASLLGADKSQAEADMHAVIAFEIELSMVRLVYYFLLLNF